MELDSMEVLILDEVTCERCGEPPDDVMPEFWDPTRETSVIMHEDCGVGAGLELA